MFYASYSDAEETVIRQGIDAIRAHFRNADGQGKKNLLLCLDKYLDPWFGYELSCADEIFRFLEEVVISGESIDITDDALNLISSYGHTTDILEENLDHVPESLQFDAKCAIAQSKGVCYMGFDLNDLDKYFVKSDLIPAIAVDVKTKQVLMLAYMNKESLRKTLETGYTWYWSRSRQELWNKGATSGHLQKVVSIFADCDDDTLLLNVEQTGNACHTGSYTCFFKQIYGEPEVK